MLHQPVEAVRHVVVIVRHREAPGGRALEDAEAGDLAGDLGHELEGAGPRADHRHSLAGQVDVMAPLGGVEGRAFEAVAALDVGQARPVELAHGGDHRIGLDLAQTILRLQRDLPDGAVLIPDHFLHLGLEADLLAQIVAVGDATEIVQQNRLGGEVLRPVVVGLEAVGVDVVGAIHPAAGIGVLQPGPANIGVLLDDLEVDAGLAEADSGQKARHARPNHQHMHAPGRFLELGRLPMGVLAGCAQRQFVGQKLRIALWDIRAGHKAHHPAHQVAGHRGRLDRTAFEEGGQRRLGFGAELRLLRFRNARLASRQRHIFGTPFLAQPAGVAGDVDKRGRQGRLMGAHQRLIEGAEVELGHGLPP